MTRDPKERRRLPGFSLNATKKRRADDGASSELAALDEKPVTLSVSLRIDNNLVVT